MASRLHREHQASRQIRSMRSCFAKFEAKIQWCLRDVGQMDKARTHGFGRNSMGQSLTVGVGWQHEAMAEEIERKMTLYLLTSY